MEGSTSILKVGISLVVVSRGAEGVIVVSQESSAVLRASVCVNDAPVQIGAVGCGDALVGGIAVGLKARQGLAEVIRLGVSCGAANLLGLGPGICQIRDIQRLLPQVNIEMIG